MSTLVLATIAEQDNLTELINQLGKWKIKREAKLYFLGQSEDATDCWRLAASFRSEDEAQRFVAEYGAMKKPTDDSVQFEILNLLETPLFDALDVLF